MKTLCKLLTLSVLFVSVLQSCSENKKLMDDLSTTDKDFQDLRNLIDTLNLKIDDFTLPTGLANETNRVAVGLNTILKKRKKTIEQYAVKTTIPQDSKVETVTDAIEDYTETHTWKTANGNVAKFTLLNSSLSFSYTFNYVIEDANGVLIEKLLDGFAYKYQSTTDVTLRFYENNKEIHSLQWERHHGNAETLVAFFKGEERVFFRSTNDKGTFRVYKGSLIQQTYSWSKEGKKGWLNDSVDPANGGKWGS